MEAIKVIINKQGQVVIDAEGFKGADCKHATRFLTEALKMTSETDKPELYETVEDVATVEVEGQLE